MSDAFADAGYQGVEKRGRKSGAAGERAIAMFPFKRKALDKSVVGELTEKHEHAKAGMRGKVEHPFQ